MPLAMLCIACAFCAVDHTVLWTFPTESMPASPTFYPAADQPERVVLCAGKSIFLVDGAGKECWHVDLETSVAASATVADIDRDGATEILAPLSNGTIVCLNPDGLQRWKTELNTRAESFCPIVAADVHSGPGLELIVGFGDGWLYCLRADGAVLWRFFGDVFRMGPPAAGDADGDGYAEILYGTDNGNIYCLDGFGEVKWRYSEMAPYGRSGVNLADLDGDRLPEVLVTRSNTGNATCLMALDGRSGAFRWRTKDFMQSYCSNVTADLDGDGHLETLHGDKGNWLYCTNADGSERWRTELNGRGIFWAPAVADIDGNGAPDILVPMRGSDAASGACLFRLDADGAVQEPLKLGSSGNAGPAIGDINGDGRLEALVATEGPIGLRALTWNAAGKVAWPCLRGDSAMTARGNVPAGNPAETPMRAVAAAARMKVDPVYLGQNTLTVAWDTPTSQNAFATVSVRRGETAEIRVIALRENQTNADLSYNVIGAEPAEVTVRIAASGAKDVAVAATSVIPRPANACAMEEKEKVWNRACAAGDQIGADTTGLRTRIMMIKAESAALDQTNAFADLREQAKRATALRRDAQELSRLAEVLERQWNSRDTGSFMVWQDTNAWDTFDPKAMPETFDPNLTISLPLFQKEQEDLVLNLLNTSSKSISVRCIFTPPNLNTRPASEPPLAQCVTVRRGLRVPAPRSGMVMDLLPEMDLSRTITLAPGEVSQVWLVVDTYTLEPGPQELTLYLGSMEEKMTLRTIPIALDVQPVELPVGVYAQMNWVGIDLDESSDQQLKDMIDHGISVVYGPKLPPIPLDENAQLAGPVDWSHTDAGLARAPAYFQLLFSGPPAVQWPQGLSVAETSDLYEKGFAAAVRELAKHLSEKGFGYERWAFYPMDEPWLTGFSNIPQLRRFCERVKAADPQARNYADPTGLLRIEYVQEFKDLIDVWQPEMNILKRDPELTRWFKENAKAFWAYEATDPNKELLPLGYYRGYAWLAWKLGLDGAGFWCYKSFDDYWPLETNDWSVVYPANQSVIPSRRWEAVRDGQEDYRLFYALRKEIRNAAETGRDAHAQRAQNLLDEAVETIIGEQARTIDEITRQTRDYELDYNRLMEYRQRIGDEILQLRAGK